MFNNVYKNKRILISGHTGFKGTWLSLWLKKLGAEVHGYSINIPTSPSMFEQLGVAEHINHNFGDIRDLVQLEHLVDQIKPDFIFHLAAQAIVSTSYSDPIQTISTNVLGTANILDILRRAKYPCIGVIITSDKCYENVEWLWGYKETDQVGGKDIYSGSKGAAEIIFHSYYHSFFAGLNHPNPIASARAGNVIGGGDWAKDRIVVDAVKAWSQQRPVELRCPTATRPWQHVLEPLSGYLALGEALHRRPTLSGESYNFGPKPEKAKTVRDLIVALGDRINLPQHLNEMIRVTDNIPFHEAGLLKLNCEKAQSDLKWEATLSYDECTKFVADWYSAYINGSTDMYAFTMQQISDYEHHATQQNLPWANP